jgi:fatty acid desaturase
MAADRRVLILRAVVLAAGYGPWVFGYMLLAFALAYASPWITVPIAWSYLALYGGLCYAWLPEHLLQRDPRYAQLRHQVDAIYGIVTPRGMAESPPVVR